jgi:hypothetical protein
MKTYQFIAFLFIMIYGLMTTACGVSETENQAGITPAPTLTHTKTATRTPTITFTPTITLTPTVTPIPATPDGAEGLIYDPAQAALVNEQGIVFTDESSQWVKALPEEIQSVMENEGLQFNEKGQIVNDYGVVRYYQDESGEWIGVALDDKLAQLYGEGVSYKVPSVELADSIKQVDIKLLGFYMGEQLEFSDPEIGPQALWNEFLKVLAYNPAMQRMYGWTTIEQVESYIERKNGVIKNFVYPVRDLDAVPLSQNPVKLIDKPVVVDLSKGLVIVYGDDPEFTKTPTNSDSDEMGIYNQNGGYGYKLVVRDGQIRIHILGDIKYHVCGISNKIPIFFELMGRVDHGSSPKLHKEIWWQDISQYQVADVLVYRTVDYEKQSYTSCLFRTENYDYSSPLIE